MELKGKELIDLIKLIGLNTFNHDACEEWETSEEIIKSFDTEFADLKKERDNALKNYQECGKIWRKDMQNNATTFNKDEALKKYSEADKKYSPKLKEYILEKLGLPEYDEVEDKFVGSDERERTLKFTYKDGTITYLTFDASYTSWDGTDYYDVRETQPVEKMVTFYETV